jgi:PAS domain S-box-containing protein
MRDRTCSYLVRVGLLCSIYVSTATLGLSLDAVSGVAAAVWPPTGIALAALLLGGYRLWPGIALGAFLVNMSAGAPPLVASGMAAGNTMEALLATYLLRRRVGFSPALERLRDVGGLVIHAAFLSTLVSATIGVTSGWLGGLIPTAHYGQAWWTWWLGDMLADLLVAPLVLLWNRPPALRLSRRAVAEFLAVPVALGGISLLVFGNLGGLSSTGASYLFFPPLIWTALRYGPSETAMVSAGVSLIAIWGTAQGWGPFVRETLRESLLLVQAFMGIVAMTSLLLAAAVAERRRAEAQQARLYQEAQEARAKAEDALALLDTFLANAPVGLAFLDQELRYRQINPALAAINGLPPAAHLGRSLHEVLPALAPRLEPLHRQVLETGEPIFNVDICGEKPAAPAEQGAWVASYYPVRARDGRILGVGAVVLDVTERQRAEEARARLAAIVASSDDAIIGKTLAGVITSWNAGAERLYGYAADEVIGQSIALLIPAERPDELPAILARLRRRERIRQYETVWMRKDGQRLDVSIGISPILDTTGGVIGAAAIARDITERKQIEADLKAALREKEVLLREMHHRVKNNLQVVSSLLALQAHAIQDRRIRAYFEESRDRIHAIALIHEKLYQSDTLVRIDMTDYLQDLATSVVRSYRLGQQHIALEVSAEAVSFTLETALPCGLLLHELLANCLKHAFPDGRSGTIGVTLRRQSQHTYVLTVCDTGVGLPPGLDVRATASLGWKLVRLLAAQLHGTLACESHEGTTVTLIFRELPSHARG